MTGRQNHLPVILLTGKTWNPSEEFMQHGNRSREFMEMRTIRSLTSGVSKLMIHSMMMHPEYCGETDITLSLISEVYDAQNFCERLISSVNITMAYHDDLDAWEEHQKVSSVISNDRHSRVTPKEVTRKWSKGLETAKNTLSVMIQYGICMAVHPMMHCLRVDHLHLH